MNGIRWGPREAALAALWLAALPARPAPAQALADETGGGRDVRFASLDVGLGGVVVRDAEAGLSYGVAADVADLLVSGASLRFGFRFWTSEDELADGRVVDVDDTVFSISLRRAFPLGRATAYAGLGAGAHVVSARFAGFEGDQEGRDGFHPGLEGLAGLEVPAFEGGFIGLFAELHGSLVSDVAHAALHVGTRLRFDRLGGGGDR
ncbi:MAG: hypothetical protein RRA92_03580 [Gemmatimonadota bacterium]|nr:hypothetical protein [Gemmatimonadota bacterium]